MKNNVKIQDDTQSLQSCVSVSVTELRIGNLVEYNFEKWSVASIFKDGQLEICRFGIYKSANLSEIKPIQITNERLLECGFEKTESDYQIQIQKDDKAGNTDYWIYVDSGFDNETNKFVIQIVCQEGCWFNSKNEYLHQLQNFYHAITGFELQIGNLTEH
jgi:hypothetical protein